MKPGCVSDAIPTSNSRRPKQDSKIITKRRVQETTEAVTVFLARVEIGFI
jgi:hypothetical protein